MVYSEHQLRLIGPDGQHKPLQTRILNRWSDGSVRWCLIDFLATTVKTDGYQIEVLQTPQDDSATAQKATEKEIATGVIRAAIGGKFGLLNVQNSNGIHVTNVSITCRFADPNKTTQSVVPQFVAEVLEHGPIRWRVGFRSTPFPGSLVLFGHLDFFVGSPVVRVQITLQNTSPAGHPGGNWDLGATGSVFLRGLRVEVVPDKKLHPCRYRISLERGQSFEEVPAPIVVHQESSGGINWRSSNHVNRNRDVPLQYCGYQFTIGNLVPRTGLRATPIVLAEGSGQFVGMTMPHFWENFPKTIAATDGQLVLDLFPNETELQGGEQKTHTFYLAFGHDTVTDEPLIWCRSPMMVHTDPDWYASTGAVPYLTPVAADSNAAYLRLVNQAIEGNDNFFTKREVIDEYGWRNFGDVYADHEAVFHKGPQPLISHYNNQFDVVGGCAVQFLRSADPRWWNLLIPAADHTCDIDVYHTDGDKAAYNRGLFWMTFHYADADTGTHRGYPRSLRHPDFTCPGRDLDSLGEIGLALKQQLAAGVGGGPGASHNYNAGLMLAYFLTGNPLYRDTAIDLARFVIRMDAPRRVFWLLSGEYTGLATMSGSPDYHGPGRGAANSVDALLVGHQLTGDSAFLEKAEQIIRRVVHPYQDLASLDLLNAELRWFYTMFLQALGRYLDYKVELGQLDRMYAYARLTLLHYARWMATNERPYLDAADQLQYPTETWVAQEMRKVEAFQFAAKHTVGEERVRFLERAQWFFRYVEQTLADFPTKSLCRPVVLMLNLGWSHAWWQHHPDTIAPEPTEKIKPEEFGTWRMFVPQKTIALRRGKMLIGLGAAGGVIALLGLAAWLL
jgi:hypothetical protein